MNTVPKHNNVDAIKSSSIYKTYFYKYLRSFIYFLVPNDKYTLYIDHSSLDTHGDVNFSDLKTNQSNVVISEVLGHVKDVGDTLAKFNHILADDGRIVVIQYSSLWGPVFRFASFIGLRTKTFEQNWLTMQDLKNFLYVSGFDVVKNGTKMLLPIYIPVVSVVLNRFVANLWPFNRLGLFHYAVARKQQPKSRISNPSFSVVIPARNEAGTIERMVKELPNLGLFTELIFIEGNSTDNTYEEIERIAALYSNKRRIKVGRQTGKGKGDAVRLGFDMAEGDILAIYDADMTVPPDEVKRFYDALIENRADFVNGSRLVYSMQKQSMRVLNFIGNKFFSLAFSWILGQPLKDTLCGTKVLWRSDYDKIKHARSFFGDFDPFGDFDLLFGAAKLSMKIVDMPVHYLERTYGTTNISRWKHGWLLLKMTVFASKKMKFI